jgi:hypothetical protein
MKKILGLVLVAILALVGFTLFASPANATETPAFQKYDTTQTWYAPSPATVDQPFAVPQTTTVLECGGIKQVDQYTIDTPELEAQYKALIAGGILTGMDKDAPFHPRGVVTALPECAPVVIVPEKPVDIVETLVTWGDIDCATKTYPIYTTTITTGWVYVEESNTWIKGEPVSNTIDSVGTATAEDCPVIVPPVDTTPDAPVDTTPVDEAPVTITPVVDEAVEEAAAPIEVAKVQTAQVDLPETKALAYTGTSDNLKNVWIAGIVLAGLGAILVLVARLRRGPSKAGVVNR